MSKILVLGLPGSGKTTQVDKLAEHLGVETIKMGVLLRQRAQGDDEMALMLRDVMGKGELVSDEVVSKIIRSEAEKEENKKGFVMEGYPRTVEQIELFDPLFDKVFYLEVPIEEAKNRLSGRGREDDKAEVIETRLKVQMEDLQHILDYYQDKLITLDGTKSIDEVFSDILAHLNG